MLDLSLVGHKPTGGHQNTGFVHEKMEEIKQQTGGHG